MGRKRLRQSTEKSSTKRNRNSCLKTPTCDRESNHRGKCNIKYNQCALRPYCIRPEGHTGRCSTDWKRTDSLPEEETLENQPQEEEESEIEYDACTQTSFCMRPVGHTGRCNQMLKRNDYALIETEETPTYLVCGLSESCIRPSEHTGRCSTQLKRTDHAVIEEAESICQLKESCRRPDGHTGRCHFELKRTDYVSDTQPSSNEQKETVKPKQKKPPASDVACTVEPDCIRPANHTGKCGNELKHTDITVQQALKATYPICQLEDSCIRVEGHPGKCNREICRKDLIDIAIFMSKPSGLCLRNAHCQREDNHRGPCRKTKVPTELNVDETEETVRETEPTIDDADIVSLMWAETVQSFRPLEQSDITNLEKMRQDAADLFLSNSNVVDLSNPFLANVLKEIGPEGTESPDLKMKLKKIGRYYSEVWEEREFIKRVNEQVKSHDEVQVLESYGELVEGFDPACYVSYLEQLNNATQTAAETRRSIHAKRLATDATFAFSLDAPDDLHVDPKVPVHRYHPASWGTEARIESVSDLQIDTQHPAAIESASSLNDGDIVDDDEIVQEFEWIKTKLVSLLGANWWRIRNLYQLAQAHVSTQPILDYDKQLAKQMERFYEILYPDPEASNKHFCMKATPRDIVSYVTRQATPQSATVITHATNFALGLSIGDQVDALDRNGTWHSGRIADLHREGGVVLRYVKVHFEKWTSASDEWISTFGGRILPPGMCIPTEESLPAAATSSSSSNVITQSEEMVVIEI